MLAVIPHLGTNDLDSGKDIEFRVLGVPPPRCFDDLNETEEVKEFYTTHRTVLAPKFI